MGAVAVKVLTSTMWQDPEEHKSYSINDYQERFYCNNHFTNLNAKGLKHFDAAGQIVNKTTLDVKHSN